MKFCEKVKTRRKELRMTQEKLAQKIGVSRRAVTAYETGQAYPRTKDAYKRLADVLDVTVNYLMTEDEAFVVEMGERFGESARKGAQGLVSELTGLFAGGEMAEEDMDALMFAVQEAYVMAKQNNKKYAAKKFREEQS